MARAAIFLTDFFAGRLLSHSGENPDLPATNVSRALPGELYEQAEGQHNAGSFEVGPLTGYEVRVDEGAGVITVPVLDGWYWSASALATGIETALNASASLGLTYWVIYSTATRKFVIEASAPFILANAVTADNLLTGQCGYAASDTSSSQLHRADYARSSAITHLIFDLGQTGWKPNLIGMLLESVGGTDSDATSYDTVHVYASDRNLGRTWARWDQIAPLSLVVSDRPANIENTLQAAITDTSTAYQFWAVFWSHPDDHKYHRIRVLRACAALSSSTRTAREVEKHQLAQRTTPLSIENQHPVRLLSEYRITVEMERWGATDYRAVKVAADRYGSEDGVFFALRWTDLLSGALTVRAEADDGLAFYGSIRSSSVDRYSGADSDYMTGSLSFGQLR